MSFGIFLTALSLWLWACSVVVGLLYGACLMRVPAHWIVVGGVVLVGFGILTGVKVTRQKDSAS